MGWTLADIRAKFRTLTGRPTTTQISDAACNLLINDFYTRDFFRDTSLEAVRSVFEQELSALDSGEYSIDSAYVTFNMPAFINGRRIHLTFDRDYFFGQYPDDEDYQSSPGLAIGVVSPASVLVGDFAYMIEGYSYHTTGVEGALNGSNIPTGKYGAWLVEITTAGALVITAAGANATGYLTAGLALQGLVAPTSGRACVGFVIVQNASGADFVPGTTLLSAAGITDSYIEGRPDNRDEPCMALIWGRKLFVRPKSDDIHRFKCDCTQKPTVMATDAATPLNEDWGLALAYGTAIKYLAESDNGETGSMLPGLYDREIENIQLDYYRNLQQREVTRSF